MKLTRRHKYLLRDGVIGTLIGFGIACMPFWEYSGAANFAVTALSLSWMASLCVIGTNPIWSKKKPARGANADELSKGNHRHFQVYTIRRDLTI